MTLSRTSRDYVQCLGIVTLSLSVWFQDYFLRGWTFLSEAGQMLWADWRMARTLISHSAGVSEWNPYILFGVDYVGREPFLNPLRIGASLARLIPDDKLAFMLTTLFFLAMMGLTMYHFLRTLKVNHLPALIGASMFMLAPKWADDAYHGPNFIVGYALLPVLFLLILRMYESGFRRLHHFLWLSVIASLMYLSMGVMILPVSYLFLPFFFYLLYLHGRENPQDRKSAVLRALAGGVGAGLLFLALSSVLLLPFMKNYSYAERSLYSPDPGFTWKHYRGLIFPWVGHFYSQGMYDLAYWSARPSLFVDNIGFYSGILVLPILVSALMHRSLNKIESFFLVTPILWLILYSRPLMIYFPVIPTFERLTKGTPSASFARLTLIFCFSVLIPLILDRIAQRGDARQTRLEKILQRACIGFYAAVTGVYLALTLVINSQGYSALHHRWLNKETMFVYYYFYDMAAIFIALFFLRTAALWIYHRRLFLRRYGMWLLLAIVIADFELCFRFTAPFTNMDDRYTMDQPQNAFVVQHTQPLDRLGAFQFQLAPRHALRVFADRVTDFNFRTVPQHIQSLFYKGYLMPLYEPSFSYFPLTASRSFYGFHESLMPSYFWDYEHAMNAGDERYIRQSWIGLWDPHSKLLDISGIKYLYWYEPIADPRLRPLQSYGLNSWIYENRLAVPRAYTVNRVEYYADRKKLLARLEDKTFNPLSVVTTEDEELFKAMKGTPRISHPGSPAKINVYSPDHVQVTVTVPSPSVLVLNDMYYPNWSVTINHLKSRLYRVNGVFRGALLLPGLNTVEFDYHNAAFHLGMKISAVAWLGVLGFFLVFFVSRKRGSVLAA